MEAQTATTPSEAATGSRTLADLLPLAGREARATSRPSATRTRTRASGWTSPTPSSAAIVEGGLARPPGTRHRARGQGRDPLQHPPGVDLLGLRDPLRRRRRWCPIYQTNSPEECQYVLDHSEADGRDRRGRGASSRRSARSAASCPRLEHVISMEPLDGDDVISFDELREKGRARSDEDYRSRIASVRGVGRRHLHLHLRHDRPAEGLHHRPRRTGATCSTWSRRRTCSWRSEVAYLFLPLAHAFARLIQLGSIDVGATIVYWERDPAEDHPQPDGGEADLLPLRPADVREDLRDGRLGGARQGAARAGHQARHEGAPDAGARRGGPGRPAGGVRPGRPGAVPERAQHLRRATSSRRSRAPPRSPRRSSSSSTPAACWCSRAGA